MGKLGDSSAKHSLINNTVLNPNYHWLKLSIHTSPLFLLLTKVLVVSYLLSAKGSCGKGNNYYKRLTIFVLRS